MILKNCADIVEVVFDWLVKNFNEICIVVDPNNYDNTLQLTQEFYNCYGDKVNIQIRPFDDFSTQINHCFDMATKEWIYIASGDEIVEEVPWDKVIDVMNKVRGEIAFFPRINLQKDIYHMRPIGYPDNQFRLFKNNVGIKMNGKVVDETLDISNRRIVSMMFNIIHFGHLRSKEALLQKGKDRVKFVTQDGCDGIGLQAYGEDWFNKRNEEWDQEIKRVPRIISDRVEEFVPKDHWLFGGIK